MYTNGRSLATARRCTQPVEQAEGRRVLALLACLMFAGPPAEETGRVAFTTRPDESRVPERFRLTSETFPYRMTHRLDSPGYSVWSVRFPSPVVTPDAENNTVHGEYFRPTRPG